MGQNKKIIIIAAIMAMIFLAAGLSLAALRWPPAFGKIFAPKHEWQKGMCYATWNSGRYSSGSSNASLREMANAGVKWVAIVTTWYQQKCSTNRIFPNENTPSDDSIIHAIKAAHSLGMKVMIKPHLDIVDVSDGSWRGEITCSSDPDWQVWFENYRDFIVHYAELAEENNVEMLCIGTELASAATIKENMWKDMVIKPVRDIYGGPLTYAANWDEEYKHVKFWDALDYIGIDAYFPLSDKESPILEEIKMGWEKWIKEIEELQKKVNKPVIFPEVGYCSADGAAKTPWEEKAGSRVNLELQANCYRALLETFWNKEWFYGVYWWRWGTDIRFGGPNSRGFSPQNKGAQKVMSEWYGKKAPH